MSQFINVDNGTGSTSITAMGGSVDNLIISGVASSEIKTPAGTEVSFSKERGISPSLYFRFVKSKLEHIQIRELERSLQKLQMMIESAKELGQDALYEDLMVQLAVIIREQEAVSCGIDKVIMREDIDKFRYQLKEKKILFVKLENFCRPIPDETEREIKKVRDKQLFDEYWVLAIDSDGASKKTTKEKIVEKDPILFGQYSYSKDRFYYITDWEDEYCDLSLDKMIKKYNTPVKDVLPITAEIAEQIKDEVLKRHKGLQDANRENWRQKALEEENRRKQLESEIARKNRWFERMKKFLNIRGL